MKNKSILVLAIALTLVPVAKPLKGAAYERIDLGKLGYFSEAKAVNNNGQIVGYWNPQNGYTRPFLYENGVMKDLGNPWGYGSLAYSINDRNQIVGEYGSGTGAWLYEDGVYTSLGSRSASSINNSGQIVGFDGDGGTWDTSWLHVTLWENNTKFDLGTMGGNLALACDINNSGQIVGHSNLTHGSQYTYPFFYDDGNWTNLGYVKSGHTKGCARSVNDLCQVVGFSSRDYGGDIRAFLWEDGDMIDLGPGEAMSINNMGQVVGRFETGSGDHAFFWENRVRTDLGPGQAFDINDDGWVVGESGSGTAMLWVIHEPSTHIYNDGGLHTIDFQINEEIEVYDSTGGNPTTVNLVSGGSIEHRLRVLDNSYANVLGGYIKMGLFAYDNSKVDVSGGSIHNQLNVFDNSYANVSGGYVKSDLSAFDNSNVDVSGGILAGLHGSQNSHITFSGGAIIDLYAYDNCQIDVTGGTIEADLKAGSDFGSHTAVITIHGRGFNYPLGEITVSSGTLTGALANGDPIKNDFRIYSNASIVLVSDSGKAYPFCWDYLTQCYGDSDDSSDVKGADFLVLKNSWFKCYPDPDYNPCADFNRSGCVDGADFLILKSNWYKRVPADCIPGDPYGIYQ